MADRQEGVAACRCDPSLPENVTDAQCPQHGILAFMQGVNVFGGDPADEVVAAAQAFVAATTYFRQPKACRAQFERLAVAVLALPEKEDDPNA